MAREHYFVTASAWVVPGFPFEASCLGQFLTSRPGVRPSGIIQLVDEQLALETGWATERVRRYLDVLAAQRRVVRDGAWLWVVEAFALYPKNRWCLAAAERDVRACTSVPILTAWVERYPLQRRWADERLAEIRPRPAQVSAKPPPAAPAARATFRGGEPERAGEVLGSTLDRLRREAGSA